MAGGGFLSEKDVLDILGQGRVFCQEEVMSVWDKIIKERGAGGGINLADAKKYDTVYTENDVKPLAERKGQKDLWLFFFDPGFSLHQMLEILGRDGRFEPYYAFGNEWLFVPSDGIYVWAKETAESGYYLVNMTDLLGVEENWFRQSEEIRKMGRGFRRVPTRLAVTIQVSYFLLQGNYLLSNFWHWGPEIEDLEKIKIACMSRVSKNGVEFCNYVCLRDKQERDTPKPANTEKMGVFVYLEKGKRS